MEARAERFGKVDTEDQQANTFRKNKFRSNKKSGEKGDSHLGKRNRDHSKKNKGGHKRFKGNRN